MSNFPPFFYAFFVGGQLVILTCLLDLVQAVVQTLFILEAMRRRSGEKIAKTRLFQDETEIWIESV